MNSISKDYLLNLPNELISTTFSFLDLLDVTKLFFANHPCQSWLITHYKITNPDPESLKKYLEKAATQRDFQNITPLFTFFSFQNFSTSKQKEALKSLFSSKQLFFEKTIGCLKYIKKNHPAYFALLSQEIEEMTSNLKDLSLSLGPSKKELIATNDLNLFHRTIEQITLVNKALCEITTQISDPSKNQKKYPKNRNETLNQNADHLKDYFEQVFEERIYLTRISPCRMDEPHRGILSLLELHQAMISYQYSKIHFDQHLTKKEPSERYKDEDQSWIPGNDFLINSYRNLADFLSLIARKDYQGMNIQHLIQKTLKEIDHPTLYQQFLSSLCSEEISMINSFYEEIIDLTIDRFRTDFKNNPFYSPYDRYLWLILCLKIKIPDQKTVMALAKKLTFEEKKEILFHIKRTDLIIDPILIHRLLDTNDFIKLIQEWFPKTKFEGFFFHNLIQTQLKNSNDFSGSNLVELASFLAIHIYTDKFLSSEEKAETITTIISDAKIKTQEAQEIYQKINAYVDKNFADYILFANERFSSFPFMPSSTFQTLLQKCGKEDADDLGENLLVCYIKTEKNEIEKILPLLPSKTILKLSTENKITLSDTEFRFHWENLSSEEKKKKIVFESDDKKKLPLEIFTSLSESSAFEIMNRYSMRKESPFSNEQIAVLLMQAKEFITQSQALSWIDQISFLQGLNDQNFSEEEPTLSNPIEKARFIIQQKLKEKAFIEENLETMTQPTPQKEIEATKEKSLKEQFFSALYFLWESILSFWSLITSWFQF